MFTDIDHVGMVVRDLDAAVALYTQAFDVQGWERVTLPERHMAVAIAHVGAALIELIAPTSADAAFAKFLDTRGPGMHHVAYRVDDIERALVQAKARSITLIDEHPRPGLHGTLVAFLHPKSTMGVLIELVEHVER